ncbi:MAG: EI24 domain-containing protein [Boseongicola sp.]|nr:EI24 domain-containing protein [Boseongicola sp.]
MILTSIADAISQLSDPRFRSVLIKGVGLTIGLLAAAYAVIFFFIQWFLPDSLSLPFIGEITFVDTLLSWASVILMLGLSVFLMVPVASAFTGLFLEDVADAVEERHYPAVSTAPRVGIPEGLREGLSFLAVLIVANIAALVLYFTPLAPFVFYGLNGFLLGREYFRLIAVRRLGRSGARKAFRANLVTIWAAGALMAVPLTIPVLNLLVPVVGAAAFTHLYHRLQARA